MLKNFINGVFVDASTTATLEVTNPADESVIAKIPLSTSADIDNAMKHARNAFPSWSGLTVKQRAGIMFKFHQLVEAHSEELGDLIVKENGKNMVEALADVAKGEVSIFIEIHKLTWKCRVTTCSCKTGCACSLIINFVFAIEYRQRNC